MLKKIAILLIIFFIYRSLFVFDKTLSSGDFPYLFLENIKEFSFLPPSGTLWLTSYYQVTAKLFVQYLGLSWNFAEKILWFWPFLFLSIVSSYYLTKSWFGVLIYTTNTYVLMLVGGGQMGVALAYSLAPFVLASFIKFIDRFVLISQNFQFQIARFERVSSRKANFKFPIGVGLILGVQMMFDPRIVYITFIAIFLYLFLVFIFNSNKKKIIVRSFFLMIPVFISIALNSFWIISLLKHGLPPEDIARISTLGFRFLSFADFSHAFSLLHPNWPENIFGKVYFLQPEFLLLPILAYSSLLFISKLKSQNAKLQLKTQILYFSLLGLIGVFLAKGSNPPFGEVNEFLFQNFPGMAMFRDATKWYVLVVLSYSVLIPFSLEKISKKVSGIILVIFLIFWLFSIRPAISGQLEGTFKPRDVPQEYVELKDFLYHQPQFFQTLWMPRVQRFGFSSKTHPAVAGIDYFNASSPSEVIEKLKHPETQKLLENSSIKYIIVPYDSQKELFVLDRKYSEEQHDLTVEELEKMPNLRQLPSIGRVIIFEIVKI